MVTSRGKELAKIIRQRVADLKLVCQGVDEVLSGRAPVERWSPKQVVSHLCGPDGVGHLPFLQTFFDSEAPLIDLVTEDPFFTEKRAAMSFSGLVAECELNYEHVASFVEGLNEAQLARTAHIPKLKDTPLGEYPTLDGMIYVLGDYHFQSHADHLREILEALSSQVQV